MTATADRPAWTERAAGAPVLAEDEALAVSDLQVYFEFDNAVAKAVDGVSFRVKRGQTLAVVGESGSGKSVTSLAVMRLISSPGRIVGGQISYRKRTGDIVDLAKVREREMRSIRGREISMIFQEPMTSLNPLFTIGDQIGEMISLHEAISGQERRQRVVELLELVEIPAAASRLNEYPHQLSGGMRQRVMIAMALACKPALLIADEPTTALDVTVQAQVLAILRRLQREVGMSILFITHNMGVVAEMADELVVMYAGQVVEAGSVDDIFDRPRHPYTKGLLNSIPNIARDIDETGRRRRLDPIVGHVPSVLNLPAGCRFSTRCAMADDTCRSTEPRLAPASSRQESRCLKRDLL